MAVSSQGMQDHLGAKSADWLANWLAELSISFPISPSQGMKNPGTRTRLEAFLAELTKWRRTATGERFKFFLGGWQGRRTSHLPPSLPPPLLNFQGKIKNFCHPTLLKIGFKIIVTPPKKGKIKITVLQ